MQDETTYSRQVDPARLLARTVQYLDRIPNMEAREGDIAVCEFGRRVLTAQHYMIYTSPTTAIHADYFSRKVVEIGIDQALRAKILYSFRIPGIV